MIDFTNIEYLKFGTCKQRDAFDALRGGRIIELLSEFDPLLVGTIPINIDIENSDLDIICFAPDLKYFAEMLTEIFEMKDQFRIRNKIGSVVVGFELNEFQIEIFGQDVPTRQQAGYRHMIVEHELLSRFGEHFRSEIIALKRSGFKTEPAFARLLGLQGDPYSALLNEEIEFVFDQRKIE